MDPKFQTSFIPRKNAAVDAALPSRAAAGIFTLVSIAIFVVAAVLAAGFSFWDYSLASENANSKTELDAYNARLSDPALQDLVTLNSQIAYATDRLQNHQALLSLFDLISSNTVQNIRWTSFSYQNDGLGSTTISMNGQGVSFADVAIESNQILSNSAFIDPVISNISITSTNAVGFTLKSAIDPSVISYEGFVKQTATSTAAVPVATSTTQ